MSDGRKEKRAESCVENEEDMIRRIVKKLQEEGILSSEEEQRIGEFIGRE